MQSVKGKDGRHDDTLGKNSKSIRPVDKIYRPTDREPFMNERQREYFRLKLLDWREDILNVARETLQNLQDANQIIPTSPTAHRRKPTGLSNYGPATGSASSSPRSTPPSSASKTGPTAIARRPANRSRSSAWKRARSPRSPSRRRNNTNAASAFTAKSSILKLPVLLPEDVAERPRAARKDYR